MIAEYLYDFVPAPDNFIFLSHQLLNIYHPSLMLQYFIVEIQKIFVFVNYLGIHLIYSLLQNENNKKYWCR